jgi:hypothetical protein
MDPDQRSTTASEIAANQCHEFFRGSKRPVADNAKVSELSRKTSFGDAFNRPHVDPVISRLPPVPDIKAHSSFDSAFCSFCAAGKHVFTPSFANYSLVESTT